MTFKGNDGGYLNAQSLLKAMFQKKGERFFINEIEISVLDVPTKKPINIAGTSRIKKSTRRRM